MSPWRITVSPAAAATGSRLRATRSSRVPGSGAKIGSARNSPAWTTGTVAARSAAARPRRAASASAGSSTPTPRSAEPDERGREQRARREPGHREALEQPEDAGQDMWCGGALQERAPGHVESAPRAARHGEQEEGAERRRRRREDAERNGPHDDRDAQ